MFESGELALVLLHLTEERPRHGYDLIREVDTLTGGAYAPSPGIVYPTLTLLEDLNQIAARDAAGSKRVFVLTDAGRARLADQKAALEETLSRLRALSREQGSEEDSRESGPIWRAMRNLRNVLEQREAGSAERQLAFDVADIIDEAARKIERL